MSFFFDVRPRSHGALAVLSLAAFLLCSSGCLANPEDVAEREDAVVDSVSPVDRLGLRAPVCSHADWQAIFDLRDLARRSYEKSVATADTTCRNTDCEDARWCCLCDSRCPRGLSGCVSRGYAQCDPEFDRCAAPERARTCVNNARRSAALASCETNCEAERRSANCRRAFGLTSDPVSTPVTFPWTDFNGVPQVATCCQLPRGTFQVFPVFPVGGI